MGSSRAISGYLGLSETIWEVKAGESKSLLVETFLVLFFLTGSIEELTLVSITVVKNSRICFNANLPPFSSFFIFTNI